MTSTAEQRQDVLSLLAARVEKFNSSPAVCMKEDGEWKSFSFSELDKRSRQLSSFFIESGITRGDKIAILCESRPEWAIALFGACGAGATVVPLDIKLTETEIGSILSDCRPKIVLCDTKHLEAAKNVREKVDSIEKIFITEDGKSQEGFPDIASLKAAKSHEIAQREANEIALIVYTSGTTGSPKGVMITFGNLLFQVNSFEEIALLSSKDRFLSILPLNHLLELTGGFLGIMNLGGSVCFCHSLFPQEVIKLLREKNITGMVGVPLFFKSLRSGIEREIKRKSKEEFEKFQSALTMADSLPMEKRREIFKPVLDELGGALRVFISGGAPLEVDVAKFFQRLGIHILEGYGLTETSPVISGNSVSHTKLGSVGKPLPGLEVRIDTKTAADTDGEILSRGPHVMAGYHHRDDLTSEVIDGEGWFHTGDIGHLDEDGFLFITGRIKNMIVLGGGKKIFPEEVEAALANAASVKELCVLGRKSKDGFKEGTEEVWVVAVPADSLVKECQGDADKIQQSIKQELDTMAQNLASYKRPTRLAISANELPKTATRKIKRPAVAEWLNSNS